MKILIKYPSRSRPERFFEGLDSITKLVMDKSNYRVICTLDWDDDTMRHQDIATKIADHPNVICMYGDSVSKIDAINRDLAEIELEYEWDILLCMSDDMRFIAYGWDQLIREGFQHNCPDLDGFLHYPDSTARNMLCTMSIMGRKYFERFGYIYHPSYQSLWCDNEAMEVAQMLGKYWYMGIQLFDHLHPAYQLAAWDEQYLRQQGLWGVDEANYIERKRHNFYLNDTGT
jgi:hypothetical protein